MNIFSKDLNKYFLIKLIFIIGIIILYNFINDDIIMFSYSYSLYFLFIGIFEIGVFTVVNKITKEYSILGYYKTKNKFLVLSKKLFCTIGFIFFMLLFFGARFITTMIVSDLFNKEYINGIITGIRMISISLLIMPILNIYRGYLFDNRFKKYVYISFFIQELVSLLVTIIGLIIDIKLIFISIIIGIVVSGLYLFIIYNKYKKEINKEMLKIDEVVVSDNKIIRKIKDYSFNYILVILLFFIISIIDIFVVVKPLINLNYTINDTVSIINTLILTGYILNLILILFGINIILSDTHKKIDISEKVCLFISKLFYYIIPITLIVSILSEAICNVLYGNDIIFINVYYLYVFIVPFLLLFIVSLILLNDNKKIVRISIFSFITKVILNLILFYTFNDMDFNACYGNILATIISYLVCSVFNFYYIGKKNSINYENLIKKILNIFINGLIMMVLLLGIKYLLPITSVNRLFNLVYIVLFFIVGIFVYSVLLNKILIKKDKNI